MRKPTTVRARLKRVLLILAAVLLTGALSFFGVQLYIVRLAAPYLRTTEDAPACDAILVLGARVYSDGTPSPVLTDRLDAALALYQAGGAPKIIVSGDHGTRGYDEVGGMMNYLLARGVPRADIFMDHAGFNTYDSFYRARDVFLVDSLIVSTQEFHMPRALYIARSLGLEAYGVASPDRQIFNMRYNNAREGLARIKAMLDVELLARPPKFLGPAIPIWGDGALTDG